MIKNASAYTFDSSGTGFDTICFGNVAYFGYISTLLIREATCFNPIVDHHSGSLFDLPQQYYLASP